MTTRVQRGRRKTSQPEGYTTIGPPERCGAANTGPRPPRAQESSYAAFGRKQRGKGHSRRERPVWGAGAVQSPQRAIDEPPGAGLVIRRSGDRNFVVLMSNRFALVVAVFVSVLLALKASGHLGFIAGLLKVFK